MGAGVTRGRECTEWQADTHPKLFQLRQEKEAEQTACLHHLFMGPHSTSALLLSNHQSLKNLGMGLFSFPEVAGKEVELNVGSSATWGPQVSPELITKMNLDT